MKVVEGLNHNIPGDLLALDIRYALEELGMITGQVTNEDLLDSIFTRFCIGKGRRLDLEFTLRNLKKKFTQLKFNKLQVNKRLMFKIK